MRGAIPFLAARRPTQLAAILPASMFPETKTSILTTHFGDPAWVDLLLRRVRAAFPAVRDERIFVIDQDRTDESAGLLRRRLGPVRILRFPRSEAHFAVTGHDHAHVLNCAVREIDSDFLLIFDSDAHPVSAEAETRLGALIAERDAVLAAKRADGTQTHPCFMLFGPRVDRDRLSFDEGQLEIGTDTGREIYAQVQEMDLAAELLRPEGAFGGQWGHFYLERSIYHHGSGSFASNQDDRLQAQVASWRHQERLFRRRVFRGHYTLSRAETLLLHALLREERSRRRIVAALRRRLRPRDFRTPTPNG